MYYFDVLARMIIFMRRETVIFRFSDSAWDFGEEQLLPTYDSEV